MKTNKEIELLDVNRQVDGDAIEQLFIDKGDYTDHQLYLNTIHYDSHRTIDELIVLTGDTEYNEVISSANFPLFFESQYSRFIPNKVKRTIERYCSAPLLKEIHEDKEVAIELCLILLSNLSNAYYQTESGWKRLSAEILRDQVSTRKESTYIKIIECLLKGTSKGAIIERSNSYTVGQESYRYRLTEMYRNKGVTKYDFQTQYCKNLLSKQYFKQLSIALDNPIARNLIKMYSKISLPTVEEIKEEAKRLIKMNYLTKKGKVLTMRNKHKNDYWVDADNRSFVEDNIELFLRLTENGYLIPSVGDSKSGGRVTDSFVLMPSWIRNLCKIDGEQIVEADYSALHPNIAMKIYGGSEEYLTHDKVAQNLNMNVKQVKIEHLSFFNKRWGQLMMSPVFEYYRQNETQMLSNMHADKEQNGYKSTSRKMFKAEVEVMTSVIEKLNSEGIIVGYVYDALFCSPKDKKRVTDIMNEEILKFGIKTKAK